MEIRNKEVLYISAGGSEYVVRQGTVGVERNRIVYFYDNTRTQAVGFSREFCLENHQMFQVSRTLADKEIPIRDIARVIENFPNLAAQTISGLIQEINKL